jgi:hypothetical protein
MGGIAGVPHQRAVRALEKAGYTVIREGKHIVMQRDRTIQRFRVMTRWMHTR